jgi:hypothetical protein
MPHYEVNAFAVLVCAVFGLVLGSMWFSAPLFGRRWMAAIGKTEEQVKAEFSPLKIVVAFFSALLEAYALNAVMRWSGIQGLTGGLLLGVVCAVGFVVMSRWVDDAMEGRSRTLLVLNGGYHVVFLAVCGAILGAWR